MSLSWAIFWGAALLEWVAYLLWRRFHAVSPKIKHSFDRSTPRDILMVILPGLDGRPRTQHENIMPQLKKIGTPLYVDYYGKQGDKARWFSTREVIRHTASEIFQWKQRHPNGKVVFFGTSLGARLSYRIAALLRPEGIATKAVLMDPPMGWRDLTLVNKALSVAGWFVYNAPVAHLLMLIQPCIKVLMQRPKAKETAQYVLDDKVLSDRLWQSADAAQRTRVSFHIGQAISLLPPLPRGNPAGWAMGDVAVIQSERDIVVKADAYQRWGRKIDGLVPPIKVPNALHSGTGQDPRAYENAVNQAFEFVLQER